MNVEQRLMEAFQSSVRVEPTPDLFSRVIHTIEEDRRHRQRVTRTTSILVVSALALVAAGAMSIETGPFGRHVHRPTMALLEAIGLVAVLVVLGPAIRRFGRGYADDLWPPGAVTPGAILRLLDVAYYLVGAGFVLLTTQLEFSGDVVDARLAEQLSDASFRLGGLLLMFGLLHATTLFVLPLIAMVDNSTRRSKALPLWVILLLIATALAALPLIQIVGAATLGDWE